MRYGGLIQDAMAISGDVSTRHRHHARTLLSVIGTIAVRRSDHPPFEE